MSNEESLRRDRLSDRQRQINSQQSAHFHFTKFARFNVLLWHYTNTEKFGIRPSQYRYLGI